MSVEAYILVGGHSSRFGGGDKALALLGGKTLAERAVEAVRGAFPFSKISFVAREAGQFRDEAERLGVRCVEDEKPGFGPVGGLHAALADCEAERLFLLACDLPFVSSELIGSLQRFGSGGRFGAIVPRQSDGRLQPLCAFYDVKAVRPVVESLLVRACGPPSMRDVIASVGARIVTPEEYGQAGTGDVFRNINTRGDLDGAAGG